MGEQQPTMFERVAHGLERVATLAGTLAMADSARIVFTTKESAATTTELGWALGVMATSMVTVLATSLILRKPRSQSYEQRQGM